MSILIAGYGLRGQYWASVLSATGSLPVTTIVDSDPEARQCARLHFPRAVVCSPSEFDTNTTVAAIVATPPAAHAAVAARLSNTASRVRLLIEKPVGDSPVSCAMIADLPTPMWSGYVERFNAPFVNCLVDAAAAHRAGYTVDVRIDRVRLPPIAKTDALFDLMAHDLHALLRCRVLRAEASEVRTLRRERHECLVELRAAKLRITLLSAYGEARTTRVGVSVAGQARTGLFQDSATIHSLRARSALALFDEVLADDGHHGIAAEAQDLALVHNLLSAADHQKPLHPC